MAGSYAEFKKIHKGVEPFFFTKVKKSLTRWELWFLFVVAQVEVKLERMDHFDSIRWPCYTRSSTSPLISSHILNAPWFSSHRNETHQEPDATCLVPHKHTCSAIKVIVHEIPTYF